MRTETTLDEVCEAVGYTLTRVLQAAYAGRALWVPSSVQADHPLACLIGLPGLRKLVAGFPGERIEVPTAAADRWAERDWRIAGLLAASVSLVEIAQAEGISIRRAEQIRAELELRGWLAYAEGPRRRRRSAASAPEILGTGGGSDEPPGAAAAVPGG